MHKKSYFLWIIASALLMPLVLIPVVYWYEPISLAILNWIGLPVSDSSNTPSYIQYFGEFGSGLTAFVSIGVLILLWKTYNLQKQELEKMHEFTREQTVLNLIFQMCEQYREIMAHTVARSSNNEFLPQEGKEGLRELIAHIKDILKDYAAHNPDIVRDVAVLGGPAEKCFESYAVCFRLLHRIFKFIESRAPKGREQDYARIPRAILSNIELEELFINCLTPQGKGMKEYIEKYEILDNYNPVFMDEEDAKALSRQYKECAFGQNNWFFSK